MEKNDYKLNIGMKIFLATPILLMIAILSLIIFNYKEKENRILLENSKLIIDYYGFYDEIQLDDIMSVELYNSIPKGGKWGSGIEDNDHVAGDAKLEGIGICKMYIIKNRNVYILINTKDEKYFINDSDDNVTNEVYQMINDYNK